MQNPTERIKPLWQKARGGRYGRQLAALFFALLALLGIPMALGSVSIADEGIELYTLNIQMHAYAELAGLEEHPLFAGLAVEELDTFQNRDYGQARFFPVWPAMRALELAGRPGAATQLLHYYNYLMFWLGLLAVYAILCRLTGSRMAGFLGVLLLWLNPRFFAESTSNIKDIDLLALCLVVFWAGLCFLQEQNFASCVWFGLAGAVAGNERIIGFAAFGLVGLVYLAQITLQKRWSARAFWRGAAAVASLLFIWFLITPAAWHDLPAFLAYQFGQTSNFDAVRWRGWVFYRGGLYNPEQNPIPWHYIPWFMLITTPLLTLALAGAWPVLLCLKNGRNPARWKNLETSFSTALALFFAAPVLYAMLRRPNLYNGWRHLYFVYASVVLFAALAVYRLWQLARAAAPGRRRQALSGLLAAILAAHFAWYGGFIARYGRDSFAYFNFLAGPHPEGQYDTDYWDLGLRTVMEEMQRLDPGFSAVPMSRGLYLNWNWYSIRDMVPSMAEGCEEVNWNRRGRARYVFENVSQYAVIKIHPGDAWDVNNDPDVIEWNRLMNQQKPVYQLRCGRTIVWQVYQNPQYNGPNPETRAKPLE